MVSATGGPRLPRASMGRWEEFEEYGLVPPSRVEYYRKCVEMAKQQLETESQDGKKGKGKKPKRMVPTADELEDALSAIHGVVPVDGVPEPNDNYRPQE